MTEPLAKVGKTVGDTAKGVPPWVWIVAIGGGFAVSYFMSRQKTNVSSSSTGDQGQPNALLYTGVGGDSGDDQETMSSSAQGPPLTNEDWARRAKTFLIGRGEDPALSNAAVDKFISAQPLTQQEHALISQAIGAVGAPPQTLPPVTGPPVSNPGNDIFTPDNPIPGRVPPPSLGGVNQPQIQGTTYTVQEGDTLPKIAQTAYGADSKDIGSIVEGADEIYNANWYRIKDPKNLTPGMSLYIPVIASNTFAHQGKLALGGGAQPGEEQTVWEIATGQIPAEGNVYYGSSGESGRTRR